MPKPKIYSGSNIQYPFACPLPFFLAIETHFGFRLCCIVNLAVAIVNLPLRYDDRRLICLNPGGLLRCVRSFLAPSMPHAISLMRLGFVGSAKLHRTLMPKYIPGPGVGTDKHAKYAP